MEVEGFRGLGEGDRERIDKWKGKDQELEEKGEVIVMVFELELVNMIRTPRVGLYQCYHP